MSTSNRMGRNPFQKPAGAGAQTDAAAKKTDSVARVAKPEIGSELGTAEKASRVSAASASQASDSRSSSALEWALVDVPAHAFVWGLKVVLFAKGLGGRKSG